AFGSKKLGQSSCYRFGIVFHRNVACRLDPHKPGFRDLPRVAFGIVDRLKWIILAPHQELRRPGLEQGWQHLLSIALFRRASASQDRVTLGSVHGSRYSVISARAPS